MSVNDIAVLVGAVVSGGGLGAVATKVMSRPVDDATVGKLRAEAKQMAQETAASEVGLLREIIKEVRDSEQDKMSRISRLEERLDKVEERERHMLTRAAVHEAWDQLAFQFIAAHDSQFPKPPPLVLKQIEEGAPDA